MRNKMTTHENARSVAAGISIPRNRFDNLGWHSFVGIVALLILSIGNSYSQSTASWPFYRSDASLSGRAKVDGPVIPDLFWVKNLGLEKIESPVVNAEGTIIFTSRGDKYVYALNKDGSEKWRFSHKLPSGSNETFSHPPTLGRDGTVYVGTEEGGFFAINLNGSLKWRVSVGGYVGIAPNVDNNGNLYLACDDAQLYVFNPAGNLLCIGSLDGLKPNNAPAIVSNKQIYVPAGNSIFVFNLSCERIARWIFPSLEEVAWVVGNTSGSTLYAGSLSKPVVLALDAQTGKQIWSYSYDARFGRPSQSALGPDGTIYFAGFDAGLLVALNPNGKEKWTHDQGSARYKTMPVVDASGDIYIVNETLGLAAFAPNKTLLWNLPNVQCKYSPAFGLDGTLYVPSLKKLYAVRPQPPHAVTLELVSGNGQTACIDSVLADSIQARVRDQYGKPFGGQPVRFRTLIGGGQPQDTTVNTSPDGIAKIAWRLGSKLGEQQLEISSLRNGQHLSGSPIVVLANAVGPKIAGASVVAFPRVEVRDSSDTTYTIFNPSDCVLTIDSLKFSDSTTFFEIPPRTRNVLIPPQGSLVVRLRFTPKDSGSHSGTMFIYSNDSTQNPFSVALQGEVFTKPKIIVNPLSLDFEEIEVGDSAMKTITISNAGTALLVVSALNFSNTVYSTTLQTPLNIPPRGSVIVPVTFKPTEAIEYSDTLSIVSNDSTNTPVIVKLDGRGTIAPDIHASPNPLELVACNDSSATDTVTIFNLGNTMLKVASLKSDNPFFTFDSAGFALAPGDSKKVAVTFSPKAVRAELGAMIIVSNDPDENPFYVTLRGEVNGPEIRLIAKHTLLELCRGQSAKLEVCIKNPSNCVLRVDSLEYIFIFPPGATKQADWQQRENAVFSFPQFIQPGDSLCLPPHRFVSTSVDFEILVRVRSNGVPDPDTLRIPIKIKPPVIAAVDTVNFGNVMVGNSKQDSAKVWSAQCQVRIDSVRITGRDAFAFSVVGPKLIFPVILEEGKMFFVPLAFSPKDTGEHIASLEIFSNDPQHGVNNPKRILLIGNGKPIPKPAPIIVVTPDTLNFGVVCDTSYQDVVVSNVGTDTLKVWDLIFDNPAFFTNHPRRFDLDTSSSTTVRVGYAPIEGQPAIGKLLVRSNAAERDSIVILEGEGGAPKIAGAPSPVEFSVVNIRECDTGLQDSSEAVYEIRNLGTCDLVIDSVKAGGNFSVMPLTFPLTIPKNSNEVVKIKLYFKPQAKGLYTDSLHIFSNALNEREHAVALKGTASATPKISATPDTVRFGEVPVNTSAAAIVRVMNIGGDTLRVTNVSVTGTVFSPDMALFALTCKDTQKVEVRFTPNAVGVFVEELTFTSNGGTKTVVLIGEGIGPKIVVDPEKLDFGVKCALDSLPVVISNIGKAPLFIKNLLITNSAFFIRPPLSFTIPVGGQKTIWVIYTPTQSLPASGEMHVISDDLKRPDILVTLAGKGGAPQIAGAKEVRFANVEVQTCAGITNDTTQTYWIKNIGTCDLEITELSANAPFAVLAPTVPQTIEPDDSLLVTLRFRPESLGIFTGTLRITSSDSSNNPFEVTLRGEGVAQPDIFVDPLVLNFDNVPKDSTKCLPLTIANRGELDLVIAEMRFSNPVFGTKTMGFTLKCGKDSVLSICFTPKEAISYSGTLTIVSNDPNEKSVVVILNGNGVNGPQPCITVTPPSLDFGKVCSDTLLYTVISNYCPATLVVSSLSFSDTAFSTTHARQFAVASNATDTVWVSYMPVAGVESQGTMTIASNDPDHPIVTVPLHGTGGAADIDAPAELVFPDTKVGSPKTNSLTITNVGDCVMHTKITITGLNADDFELVDSDTVDLNAGISLQKSITFTPKGPGLREATLVIKSNDPHTPVWEVKLIGNGIGEAKLKADPSVLDFGDVTVNEKKSSKLYLKSVGSATLVIIGCTTEPIEIFGCEYCARTDDDRIPMEPGALDSTTVEFAPKAEQEYTGTLTFQTNGNTVIVNLRGRGVVGNLDSEPNPLPVAEICAGDSGRIEGKIVNNGLGNLYIHGPLRLTGERDARRFKIVSPTFSVSDTTLLRPNEALPFVVEFTDSVPGTYNESLLVITNLHPASNPFPIPLKGEVSVDGAKIEITPLLSFVGKVDQETPMQAVLIKNGGCKALEFGKPGLLKSKYFFIRQEPEKKTLLKDESAIVWVTFKGDNFMPFEDELSVSTNDPTKPIAVAKLNGVVKDGNICFKADPGILDFGKVKVRQSADPREVKLINCSRDTRLQILVSRPSAKNDFKLSKTEFLIFPNPNTGVNFESMYVTFAPQVSGVQEEILELLISVPNSTEKTTAYVYLKGEGAVDSTKVEVVSNVITPNGDDYNEEAIVEYSESLYPQAAFHVFDLRGLPVRVLRRPTRLNQFAWDGKDENGGLVLPSVYIWILEDQGKRIASGRFVIIR